ncbi:MAG: hypothetical protein Kow0042_02300 [Calditrichia bacterium]
MDQIMQNLHLKLAIFFLMGIITGLSAQQWQFKAPMPTARKGMAVAVLQDKIWVIGGHTHGHQPLNTVEAYDPINNLWDSQVPDLNFNREDATAQTWNEKIYVFGGIDGNLTIGAVEMYDPNGGSWQTVTTMPNPRRGMASLTVDSTIWLIGGATAQGIVTDAVDVYHPESNSWETLPGHLNIARGDAMAAQINGECYVFGGHFFGPISSYEKYNKTTQSWEVVGDMPYHCGSAGYASSPDRVWIAGGIGQSGILDKLQVFHIFGGNSEWLIGPPLNTPRRELVSAIVQDKIYAIGGRGHMGGSFMNTVEELSLVVPIVEEKTTPIQDYFLMNNFPNPFNSSTLITIQLPLRDEVQIGIYDALGRHIVTLYQGSLSAGTHTLRFSTEKIIGGQLPSGLYFLRFKGRRYASIHKMFLVK